MDKKSIIKIVGRWNYLKWIFANKALGKHACIGISLSFHNSIGIREYIDHNGNIQKVILR